MQCRRSINAVRQRIRGQCGKSDVKRESIIPTSLFISSVKDYRIVKVNIYLYRSYTFILYYSNIEKRRFDVYIQDLIKNQTFDMNFDIRNILSTSNNNPATNVRF